MWWLALLGCRAPSSTSATDAPAHSTPDPGGTGQTGVPSPGPHTAHTADPAPALALGPVHEWGLRGWNGRQHHAQVAWDPSGDRLYVGFTESADSETPSPCLGTVDGSTGEPVGDPTPLGGPERLEGLKPSLAVDDEGRVVTVWQREGGGVYYERVTPGSPTTELVVVQEPDTTVGSGNHSPDLQLCPDGRAMIAWYAEHTSDEDATYATRTVRPDPAAVDPVTTIAVVPDRGPATPELALTPDGGVVLAWTDYRGATPAVLLSWLDPLGTPIRTVTAYDDGGYISRPQLAVAPDGRIALTFPVYASAYDSEVVLMVLDPDGQVLLEPTPWAVEPAEPALPTVAFVGRDAVLLAWSGAESDEAAGVFLALRSATDGPELLPAIRVSAPEYPMACRPFLATLPTTGGVTRFALSWEQPDYPHQQQADVVGVLGEVSGVR